MGHRANPVGQPDRRRAASALGRRALPVGLILLLVLGLVGCVGEADGGHPGRTASGSSCTSGSFPVSIRHAQGTTTIERAPERVVALGSADVQIAQALGAHLVGVAQNDYSSDKQWLGVEPALQDDVTLLPAVEPDLEKVTALKPDLILVTTAQPGYSKAFDKLNKIAPTVSYQKGLLEDSGEDLTRLIGKALGVPDRAEKLIKESDQQVADYADAHPDLRGQRVAFGQYTGGQTYLVVAKSAPSTSLFRNLGMELPDDLAALPVQAAPGITTVADEKLDLLKKADLVLLGVGLQSDHDAFVGKPLVAGLPVAERGGVQFMDFNHASLMLAPNPASTKAFLAELDRLPKDKG